ncbi:MAG: Nif3-like dinuclear metal center hexameric protein [Pseudomonadota bacterium]
MVKPQDLANACDHHLEAASFDDYCPNGLQVEGGRAVTRLATGVTATLALIEAAAAWNADALLVHHGWFWKGEPAPLVGMKGRRVRRLYEAGMSLLAYHLPLDAHPTLGNNAMLAKRLEIADAEPDTAGGLLWRGRLQPSLSASEFSALIGKALERTPLHIPGGPDSIETLGWCTGAAQDYIGQAADLGLDAFLSGEISEPTVHVARERGIHYFAAGHHATERYGVQALGEWLAEKFGVEHKYFEMGNPV